MIYKSIKNTIEQNGLIKSGYTVIAAVSGGADSVCLLDILYSLKDELGFSLECAHLNHNLRGAESDGDAEFVKQLCKGYGIKLHYKSVDVLKNAKGMGVEEAARKARYEFFDNLIKTGTTVIATAHTNNDNVETFFINLLRGTGTKGLCAIPMRRGAVIRPMLSISRSEIIQYLGDKGLGYRTDSTNADTDYLRNFLRHNILPELNKRCELDLFKSVSRAIDNLNTDNTALEKLASNITTERADKLLELDDAVLFRVLYKRLYDKFKIKLDSVHFNAIKKLILKPGSKEQIKNDVFAFNKNGCIVFDKNTKFEFGIYKLAQGENIIGNKRILIKNTKEIYNTLTKATIDCDKICGELKVRTRVDGDVFYSSNRKCSTKLKKIFVNDKLDTDTKNSLAIICDDNGIVFVENYGVDARYRASADTKNKLTIEI